MHPLSRRPVTIVVLLLATALSGAAQNSTWSQWRGPNRDGKSTETGLLKDWPAEGPARIWRATGVGIGYSSFSVADGKLFTLGARGSIEFVIALDEATGAKHWETANGSLFSNDRGDGPRGTPTVDGDRLYAFGGSGDLSCLAIDTGTVIWKRNVLKDFKGANPYWGLSESPLVLEDRVLVNAGGPNASIVAFNKTTGDVIWKSESDPAGYSSGVLARVGAVTQAVFMTERRALGVDVRDGTLLWSYDGANNRTANIATPVVSGNRVFVSSAYGTGGALLELSPTGAKEVYSTRDMMNHHASSVLVGDHLYGFSNSILTAMGFDDGKVAWQNRSVGKGSAIYAEGRLYLYSENGVVGLAEANPAGYVEHGRFRISTGQLPTWSHPIITNGKLIIRDQGTVYAYDVKAK
jgi:outer membrane protein assembly factor BamB